MHDNATYISVGALAECFAPHSYLLPGSPPLKSMLTLNFPGGECISCQFHPDGTLTWGDGAAVAFRLTTLRKHIEFIDFKDCRYPNATLTLVCDHQQGCFTFVEGRLPSQEEAQLSALNRIQQHLPLTGVQARVEFGTFNRRSGENDLHHAFSDDLVGMRNLYRYSPTECYEHIYLNAHRYVWHCLEGGEKGLADVDLCQTVKIADRLYLFIWQEKIIPTLGVVLIDLRAGQTDGKIMGYEQQDFKQLSNFSIGARLKVMNITHHSEQAATVIDPSEKE